MSHIESGDRALWGPLVACDSDIEDAGPTVKVVDIVAQVAVKEYAKGGTTACAETAKLVVEKIVAAYKPAARQ